MSIFGKSRGPWSAGQISQAMELYAVTDRAWLGDRTLSQCVAETLKGGATFIQLREKYALHDEMVRLCHEIMPLCKQAGVPFVVDDDVDLAREVRADGVHVGQSDEACAEARARLGEDAIIGVSASTLEEAVAAEKAGADYLGVGALFGTPTKDDAPLITYDDLKAICKAVSIPVVAIGGLNKETIPVLKGSGVAGVAVVSAIFAADDIEEATRDLKALVEETLD